MDHRHVYMDSRLLDNDDGQADMGDSHAVMDPICDTIIV